MSSSVYKRIVTFEKATFTRLKTRLPVQPECFIHLLLNLPITFVNAFRNPYRVKPPID